MTHRSICYPLQYSCLGNLKDRGAWWATVHGVTTEQGQELDTTERLTHTAVISPTRLTQACTVAVVQLLSRGHLFVSPCIAACQASLSFSISWSFLTLMRIESMMSPDRALPSVLFSFCDCLYSDQTILLI